MIRSPTTVTLLILFIKQSLYPAKNLHVFTDLVGQPSTEEWNFIECDHEEDPEKVSKLNIDGLVKNRKRQIRY